MSKRSSWPVRVRAFSFATLAVVACARTVPVDPVSAPGTPSPVDAAFPVPDASVAGDGNAGAAAEAGKVRPLARDSIDGPHEDLALDAGRPVFYASPRDSGGPIRLVAHIHGMCGAPSYACGKWLGAGTATGFMVCPTGNARCGDPSIGPPSWEAASWTELVEIMDHDLESAIAKVSKKRPAAITREGAILTGYSRGAFAAPVIARAHPGRWPYLVLIEANAPLTATSLRAAGVRAVALVAGEQGTEISGMRKTAIELDRDGYPARLFVMPRTGHLYSADMEDIMNDALGFVLAHP